MLSQIRRRQIVAKGELKEPADGRAGPGKDPTIFFYKLLILLDLRDDNSNIRESFSGIARSGERMPPQHPEHASVTQRILNVSRFRFYRC